MRKCLLLVLLLSIFVSCDNKEPEKRPNQPSSVQWKNLAGKKYVRKYDVDIYHPEYYTISVFDFFSKDSVYCYTVKYTLERRPDTVNVYNDSPNPCRRYSVSYPFLSIWASYMRNFKFLDTLTIYYKGYEGEEFTWSLNN